MAQVVVSILTATCPLAAQLLPFEEGPIKDAAQDVGGQVWAIMSLRNELVLWQKGRWSPASLPAETGGLDPQTLGRGSDGSVLCAWGSGYGTVQLLTRHQGLRSSVAAKFGLVSLSEPLITAVDGNVWLTGSGKDMYRISPTGEAAPAYSLTTNQLHSYGRNSDQYNPIYVTLDGIGRVWIWSDTLAGGMNIASLRGVLIFDGEQFTHHPTMQGLPDKKYSVIEKLDDRRMWLAVEEDGLYRVDIQSLAAERVSDPEPGAFSYVQKLFRVEDDWYVVAGAMWLPVSDSGDRGLSGVLWRLRDGRWQKIIKGMDKRAEYRQHPSRSWFRADEGLWIGSFGGGPWLVQADGNDPMYLDWRYGVPLADTQRLIRLNDRTVMAIDCERGTLAANIEDLLIPPQLLPKVLTLKPHRPLVQDSKRGIWGIISAGTRNLSEWSGEKWLTHSLPPGLDPAQLAYLCADSRDRIWLVPDYRRGQTGIYDPASGQWDCFPNYLMALQAQLGQPRGFRLGNDERKTPVFSPDGRICFLDDWSKINYYDSQTWRKWGREQIKGDETFVTDGPPFFNQTGLLCVNIEGTTWEFSDEQGWHTARYERGIRDNPTGEPSKPTEAPALCAHFNPESFVREEGISWWFTWRGQLYRGIPGLCVPQFEAAFYHPFIDSRKVLKVFADREGNRFLQTSLPNSIEEYVILFTCNPQTGLRILKTGTDSIAAQFSAAPAGEAWFIWRLDGGPWSIPTKDSNLKLQWLPNGKHQLEAVAIDSRVQLDPVPATAEFAVRISPARQIASIIAALASPEESRREAAVEALSRQPAMALPALRRAREKASDRQRWWIDVAIQRLEAKDRSPESGNR